MKRILKSKQKRKRTDLGPHLGLTIMERLGEPHTTCLDIEVDVFEVERDAGKQLDRGLYTPLFTLLSRLTTHQGLAGHLGQLVTPTEEEDSHGTFD